MANWRSGPENWADIYDESGDVVALVTKGRPSSEDDALLIRNAPRLRRALQKIIDTCNVRIDDPRSQHFDEARSVLAEINGERRG